MAVTVNPVLARELKERMRGRRATIILTVYLALLTGSLWLAYEASSSSNSFGSPFPTQLADVGSTVFEWVLFFMLLILMFLVPAQTAGAIAGERERQTLVPLQITLLSPLSILVGKVCASMAFLMLLVVAAVPLLSIAYLIGGVTIREVLGGTALVLATGVCLGTACAAISTFARRVQTATVLAYGLTLLLVVGTFVAYGAAAVVDRSRGVDGADPPSALLALNPVAIVGDLVGDGAFQPTSSPFDSVKELTDRRDENWFQVGGLMPDAEDGLVVRFEPGLIAGGGGFEGGPGFGPFDEDPFGERRSDSGFPFWLGSLLALGALSGGSLLLAARRLRTPAERER